MSRHAMPSFHVGLGFHFGRLRAFGEHDAVVAQPLVASDADMTIDPAGRGSPPSRARSCAPIAGPPPTESLANATCAALTPSSRSLRYAATASSTRAGCACWNLRARPKTNAQSKHNPRGVVATDRKACCTFLKRCPAPLPDRLSRLRPRIWRGTQLDCIA
ncbi:MAG: hypothetical protein JWM63_102 [Gammaproteobacteria bacterium]|nr:hypothetical protein [Gammaproteobacteria bacterium]